MSRIERTPDCGEVCIERMDGDRFDVIVIKVTHAGARQEIAMSEYNARRILGALSIMLTLPLSPESQKRIDMGEPKSLSIKEGV